MLGCMLQVKVVRPQRNCDRSVLCLELGVGGGGAGLVCLETISIYKPSSDDLMSS